MRRLMRLEQFLGFAPIYRNAGIALNKPEISTGHHLWHGHSALSWPRIKGCSPWVFLHGGYQNAAPDNVTGTSNKETEMKAIIAILTVMVAFGAHADSWTGQDNAKHAIAGAAIGSAVTLATSNHWHGCAASSAVGLAKEIYDHQNRDRHTASFKDFAVTAVAGCLASKTTSVFIGHDRVVFTWRF